MRPSPYDCRLGPRGMHFRSHFYVHFHYGPLTRNHPFGGSVDRLHGLGYPPPCYPSYKTLASILVGLNPTEHARFIWTHNRTCGSPASGSLWDIMPSPTEGCGFAAASRPVRVTRTGTGPGTEKFLYPLAYAYDPTTSAADGDCGYLPPDTPC